MARNSASARSSASARTAFVYPRNPMGAVYIPGAKRIEGATGDIGVAGANWIESEYFHWHMRRITTAVSGEFDTAVTRTGTKTVLASNTDTSGRIIISNLKYTGLAENDLYRYGIRCKSSTEYTLNCYVKTNNVATNAAFVDVLEYAYPSISYLATSTSNKLSGTNDWILCTVTFTTQATSDIIQIRLQNSVSGNISDAWFDVNSMTLVETGVTRGAVV